MKKTYSYSFRTVVGRKGGMTFSKNVAEKTVSRDSRTSCQILSTMTDVAFPSKKGGGKEMKENGKERRGHPLQAREEGRRAWGRHEGKKGTGDGKYGL